MPVAPHLVPLDTAKTWAKRLHRIQAEAGVATLSSCQQALAQMLGYPDWHGMEQAHAAAVPASTETPSAPDQSFESTGDLWQDHLLRIQARYPETAIASLDVIANDIDTFDMDPDALRQRVRALEDDGYFTESAFDEAIKEHVVTVLPPPDHFFARVTLADGKRALVTMPFDMERRKVPKPG